ncbi:MAG: hypothetical protein NUW37_12360 [Planctomycetes bacterium]|nr:hypothetical protein [Planctomycetota bacterium]
MTKEAVFHAAIIAVIAFGFGLTVNMVRNPYVHRDNPRDEQNTDGQNPAGGQQNAQPLAPLIPEEELVLPEVEPTEYANAGQTLYGLLEEVQIATPLDVEKLNLAVKFIRASYSLRSRVLFKLNELLKIPERERDANVLFCIFAASDDARLFDVCETLLEFNPWNSSDLKRLVLLARYSGNPKLPFAVPAGADPADASEWQKLASPFTEPGEIPADEAAKLIASYEGESDSKVRATIVRVLSGSSGSAETVAAFLLGIAKNENATPEERGNALRSLAAEENASLLLELVSASDENISSAAIDALGGAKPTVEISSALLGALTDANAGESARRAAAKSLRMNIAYEGFGGADERVLYYLAMNEKLRLAAAIETNASVLRPLLEGMRETAHRLIVHKGYDAQLFTKMFEMLSARLKAVDDVQTWELSLGASLDLVLEDGPHPVLAEISAVLASESATIDHHYAFMNEIANLRPESARLWALDEMKKLKTLHFDDAEYRRRSGDIVLILRQRWLSNGEPESLKLKFNELQAEDY